MRRFWLVAALAAVGVWGCGNRPGPGDSGLPDASDGDAPGDANGDQAPPPWRVGSEDTFEIATWNIRNFPADALAAERVAELLSGMDVDLVAVQEIADVDSFEQVVQQLDRYDWVLSDHQYQPGEYQKTGFIFRSDFIQLRYSESIFELDGYAFPRPPLQAEFIVHQPDGATVTYIAIVLHLKASLGEDNEARRRDACQKLKLHVDDILTSGLVTQVFVLGDFNDSLDDPADDNVFTAFTDDPTHYRFATRALADQWEYSYIPARVLIDHILVTADLFDELEAGTVQVLHLDDLIVDYDFVEWISDHRPVVTVMPW